MSDTAKVVVTAPGAPFAPVSVAVRLANLDALRAVALFGVLLVNLLTEFRVSLFEQFLGPATGSPLDRALSRVVSVGIESKAFILFSLLFGVGLAIQLDRAERSRRSFAVHVTRRLASLLAIGVVHLTLIWNGDILCEYALAGALALPLLRCRKSLLPLALALFALFLAPLPYPEAFSSDQAIATHVATASFVYAHGGLRAVEAFRLRELGPILALVFRVLPRTLGLFALGIWVWRAGIAQSVPRHARLLGTTVSVGLGCGAAGMFLTRAELIPNETWSSVVAGAADIAVGLAYGAALLLLFARPSAESAVRVLAPLGRMALTNYLSQSVILGLVFYGYGLGQFGKMSVSTGAVLGLCLYAAQVAASTWWLRRFRFGPMEWLWRSATYGAWQPLRLAR